MARAGKQTRNRRLTIAWATVLAAAITTGGYVLVTRMNQPPDMHTSAKPSTLQSPSEVAPTPSVTPTTATTTTWAAKTPPAPTTPPPDGPVTVGTPFGEYVSIQAAEATIATKQIMTVRADLLPGEEVALLVVGISSSGPAARRA